MARFRGAKSKYLTCFYCGKRSSLKFDGTIRDFVCFHCDATNYLDQNGEITDPPVATDREANAVQYAAPQSRASSQQDDTFCQTCLKNQHLFTKSLAQYLPDDPSDPDYPELERNYYRYRRNLEKRYPQVCADCAEKVEARIRQAGYTAKTDHLRRMMNLGRVRKTRTRTKLDWIHVLGKTLWRSGFVLQILWHFVMITHALQVSDNGMYDPDDQSTAAKVLLSLKRATESLPAADTLMRWSIWTGVMAVWWNPHFVQVNRGFTRHLLGFTQWYSFQGLIVFFRFILRGIDVRGGAAVRSGTARLAAHVGMAFIMTVLYMLAGRSIRVDTTPLFATYNTQPLVPRDAKSARQRKQEDSKTFSELFNDALDSAHATPRKAGDVMNMPPSPQSSSQSSPYKTMRPVGSAVRLGHMGAGLAETPSNRRQQQLQYDEEMDWSPITPQHRALQDDYARTPSSARFGRLDVQTPSQPPASMNPFRLKVPAAPVEPARRLRNPPWPTAAKQEPLEIGQATFTRKGHQKSSSQTSSILSEATDVVEFKQPSFFAPQRDNDTSSLADLLNQSFSLGQEQEEEEEEEEDDDDDQEQEILAEEKRTSQRLARPGARNRKVQRKSHPHAKHSTYLEPATLAVLLAVWLLAMHAPLPHGWEIQLTALSVAGVVALRGTGDAGRLSSDTAPAPVVYVLSACGVAELAAICWVGSELWSGGSEQVGWYGAGVLACMVGHQALSKLHIW
ncbi:hypothetical protein E4U43_003608 [Claviceps pusilla]|uniref:Ima1 N-terminal domain-containing protein n=1 Tax=Claviceps pusilla TaxID=123648 RepID=A0A9P7N4H3_9HYPO|nr:hypothetical protein E4U43_003608 [Claviceps pusilla]